MRTKRSGCPLITLCGGSFSQEKPGVTVSFVWYFLIFELFINLKFALANFHLKLSLKVKDFTRAKQKFHISPQEKYFTQGVALFSTGFSWEKLPPQRVMRGHRGTLC